MLFNSIQYAFFLPLSLLLYYALPFRARPWVLLATSYFFYACWNPAFLLLIIALTALNYLAGIGIGRLPGRTSKRWLLAGGVTFNLLVLAFFKYARFFLDNLTATMGWFGFHPQPVVISIAVPLGISFFVFEFIHYLVDVAKGGPPVLSPLKFAIFAAFFPTQIAGPIKRYLDFVPQLESQRPFHWNDAERGLGLIVLGLFKKMVLADNIAPIVDRGYGAAGSGMGSMEAWLISVAFAMQIYFDFSGYTDIGRGSALMFGYTVPENFRRPYLAQNISEFWRRWHISLSTWLRDYLFIPLGGSRRSLGQTVSAILVTMVLCGLWHGANWTFVMMGFYFGVLLSLRAAWRCVIKRAKETAENPVIAFLCTVVTFASVCIGMVFFRAESLFKAWSILGSMFTFQAASAGFLHPRESAFVAAVVFVSFMVDWAIEKREASRAFLTDSRRIDRLGVLLASMRPVGLVILLILAILLQPNDGKMFVYFKF
jgi:alginate O-acetyltransferase complex protein AlgI